MHRILHRINTKDTLLKTPKEFGVEVDIRTRGNQLIMHHDPFQDGEDFEDWLAVYQHGILILNVKEEGLEGRLIELMDKYNINDYFFLDQSFPFLIKTADSGESRCAARVSEYESIDTVLSLADKIDWVWVDCFTHFPLNRATASQLKDAGLKLCLVSPELQGRMEKSEVINMRELLKQENIQVNAVCTKYPKVWL